MSDAFVDSLLESLEFDEEESQSFADDYGKGRWKTAILRGVVAQEARDFSRGIQINVDLRGEGGMGFTFFVDAPFQPEENGDHDAYERRLKGYNVKLNQLKTIVHATGVLVEFNDRGFKSKTRWPKTWLDFRDDEIYNQLLTLLESQIGMYMPINVKYRTYTNAAGEEKQIKDVWGLDPLKREEV